MHKILSGHTPMIIFFLGLGPSKAMWLAGYGLKSSAVCLAVLHFLLALSLAPWTELSVLLSAIAEGEETWKEI